MIFVKDKIKDCLNPACKMALSEYNTTGFCTTFCENVVNGVSNVQVPVKYGTGDHAMTKQERAVRAAKPNRKSELRRFLDRHTHGANGELR